MVYPLVSREQQRVFWRQIRRGASSVAAARAAGVSGRLGALWFRQFGGMTPLSLAEPSGRYLSMGEREEISAGLAAGQSIRSIAAGLNRAVSTISREVARNRPTDRGRPYRAVAAEAKAQRRARRPKPTRLRSCPRLRARVQADLERHWSPQQICARLRARFPNDPEMRVSHETIYRSLYVQGRGGLRRELTACLRTGRAVRKPRRRAEARRHAIKDMLMISDRPAEADDRAVPGHWEGDLILGKDGTSAIGTLVERATRFVMLLHLPTNHTAQAVHDAMVPAIAGLPAALRRSLTWDQGSEMAYHRQISIATDLPIYFCDPHSPWQRGTNENTNGLLRQYYPKGTDLAVHSADHLQAVADELNDRPRQTLNWQTPAEALHALLCDRPVATTP